MDGLCSPCTKCSLLYSDKNNPVCLDCSLRRVYIQLLDLVFPYDYSAIDCRLETDYFSGSEEIGWYE